MNARITFRYAARRCRWLLVATLLASGGCATDHPAPIEQKSALPSSPVQARPAPARPRLDDAQASRTPVVPPATHVVAPGDKLLTIAWRYGLDVRDIARWNAIDNPDLIVVGRSLRLRPPPLPAIAVPARVMPPSDTTRAAPPVARTASVPPPVVATREPALTHKPATDAAGTATITPSPSGTGATVTRDGVRWAWPAQGKVSAAATGAVNAGIDIRGARGAAVNAAAAGTVVYSGSGLRGYGELIIVKHNDTFLSAYAHNEARLVTEGRHVAAGEQIARMGNSDTTDVKLHFEIRRNGKAVNPLQYLPSR